MKKGKLSFLESLLPNIPPRVLISVILAGPIRPIIANHPFIHSFIHCEIWKEGRDRQQSVSLSPWAEMWRSSQGLLWKLAVTLKVGSGVVVSVRQRPMSTVMTFGCSWDGALGLSNRDRRTEEIAYKPTPIPSLPSDIVSIHAGPRNSFAVTSQGQLWSWGTNQYAVPFRDVTYWQTSNEPLEIWELENVNVCTAFASHRVSGVVGDDGSVWVWGESKQGQLGLGEHITEAVVPFRVEALSEENVANVHPFYLHAKSIK